MNLEDPMIEQYLMGTALTLLGLWGLFIPYKWNILRLKRAWGQHLSERKQHMIPKVLGAILLVCGIGVLAVAFMMHSAR